MAPTPEHTIRDTSADDEELEFPDVIVPTGNSDSEEIEDELSDQYQLLPQDPDNVMNDLNYECDDESDQMNNDVLQIQTISNLSEMTIASVNISETLETDPSAHKVPEKEECVWNQSYKTRQINIDDEAVDAIKTAMAGFNLPLCHIPEWAKELSDDDWNNKIVSKIKSPE